ncbi:s-methyl-5-thioribose-1-phosphate isomerase [Streptomyces sp. NPDC001617]
MTTLIEQNVLIGATGVDILDRRCFPFERRWVHCTNHEDVAVAIEDMVTQSSGPYFAAGAGLVLAGREADRAGTGLDHVRTAAARLIATRPTNNLIRLMIRAVLPAAEAAAPAGEALGPALERAVLREGDAYLARSRTMGEYAANLIEDGDTILTHCWAESYLTETVAAVLRQGKRIAAFCTETRPYLQGARLTAESLAELGVPTTVITDGMGAHVMVRGLVTKFLTAADRVTLDGHVINKVGTLQLALSAHSFGIPYYPLVQQPDREAPDPSYVALEDRDGDEVLHTLGTRTASHRVKGYYPAFDVTPPKLVGAVVTDRGVFSPYDLASYYGTAT